MNRITLPKCHLLRASDLLEAIANEIRSDFEADNVEFVVNVPPNLFCESEQDQFVDSVMYVMGIAKEHALKVEKNPTIGLAAELEDGWLKVMIQNNCLEIDRKAADTVAASTAVNLFMEFDSNIGNALTLSFPTSGPIEARQADQPVELPR